MKYYITLLLILFQIEIITARIVKIHVSETKGIQHGIDFCQIGDTLLLTSGHYYESNILISKPLTVIGEPGTIIDGNFKEQIISISGKQINIIGIQFQNSGHSSINDLSAIRIIDASQIDIRNNVILNCHFAIHVSNCSSIKIINNKIAGQPDEEQNTGNGIHLWKCQEAQIYANSIQGHRDGIYFEFVQHSVIQDNESFDNLRYGLHFMFSNNNHYICNTFRHNGSGVAVMFSNQVMMEENTFMNNWGPASYGLLLKEISDSKIVKNKFISNTNGIYFEGTNRIDVYQNLFKSNGWAIKIQASCVENTIHHNNFLENSFDISTNGTLSLNLFDENYWDRSINFDLNKDGFADIPYNPLSLYAVIIENNPSTMVLMRSSFIQILDKIEKAIPSLTPNSLKDNKPLMTKVWL